MLEIRSELGALKHANGEETPGIEEMVINLYTSRPSILPPSRVSTLC
jgi:hypothetical protein